MIRTTYRVRVSGKIPADLLPELGHLTVREEPPETVLYGTLSDQSALFRILARIHGMNLRLLGIHRVDAGDRPG